MARYVLPVVGAVVGFIYGGPAGASMGWSLGAAVGGLVDPQVIKGPGVGDLVQQTSQEGVPRPIVFGLSQPIAGNVIDAADPRIVKKKKSGKGGPKVETESVFRTYAIRICEGPITQVLKVWKNNQLVFDATDPGMVLNNGQFLKTARFFTGAWTQNPSPDLEAVRGVGTTPAYRGTAYMVMANDDVTDMRGAIPQFQFQVLNNAGAVVSLGNVNLSSTSDAATSPADAISNNRGTVLNVSSEHIVTIVRNPSGPYLSWSPWGEPVLSGTQTGTTYSFDVLRGDTEDGYIEVADPGSPRNGYAASAAAFDADYPNGYTLTGFPSYRLYIQDTPIGDNSGGLSFSVTRTAGVGDDIPLADIVSAICSRAGMDPSMIDVSELDGEVAGLTVINTYPAYTILQTLSQVYFFAPSNYDGVLHFIPGGGNSGGTITDQDMVDDHENDIEEAEREDSISVPRVMHLLYYDVDGGLSTDKQTSERAGDRRAVGEQMLQTAVVMRATQAARVVAVNHKVTIEEARGSLKFCLPDSWLGLVPAEPVIVQINGQSRRLRITKLEVMDGFQQYELFYDRQSAFTSQVEGIPAAEPSTPPSNVIGPTLIQPLDIHILRDADDGAGLIYYVAVSGTMPAWNGALIELSLDGGMNYIDERTTSFESIMGTLEATLPDHPQAFPDEVSTLAVEIVTPYTEFEETDLTGLLNRMNMAIVGDEIIQFANADEVSEGHWEMSLLLRGRKGTQTQSHAAGTRFVLLDPSSIAAVPASLVDVGRTLTFRATSFGETEDTATVVSMLYTGQSQREREPAYVMARRDGSNAIVTWQGIGRLGSGAGVAHGLRFSGYQVTYDDGVNPAIVATTTDQTHTQDVSALSSPITIIVEQMNELTGAGPSMEVAIT